MTNSTTNEPEPSDSLKTFGLVHKACRKRTGLTQEEFAPLVGYQPSTVASIEQGGGCRRGRMWSGRRRCWMRSVY